MYSIFSNLKPSIDPSTQLPTTPLGTQTFHILQDLSKGVPLFSLSTSYPQPTRPNLGPTTSASA